MCSRTTILQLDELIVETLCGGVCAMRDNVPRLFFIDAFPDTMYCLHKLCLIANTNYQKNIRWMLRYRKNAAC